MQREAEQCARMATTAERNDRASRLQQFIRAGHVKVEYQADYTKVIIGEEVIKEHMHTFPSTKLMARVALAVEFGTTCRDSMATAMDHAADSFQYMMRGNHNLMSYSHGISYDRMWMDETSDNTHDTMLMPDPGYRRGKKPRAVKKGLRP